MDSQREIPISKYLMQSCTWMRKHHICILIMYRFRLEISGVIHQSIPKRSVEGTGICRGGRFDTEWKRWVESEKQCLAEIMERYQMEWLQKGTHEKHLSVYEYEKKMRKAEVEELEQEISSQKDIIAD